MYLKLGQTWFDFTEAEAEAEFGKTAGFGRGRGQGRGLGRFLAQTLAPVLRALSTRYDVMRHYNGRAHYSTHSRPGIARVNAC